MTLETDLLIDRRRLKRRLFVWRVVAVLAVLLAVFAWLGRASLLPTPLHVARLRVEGLITENRRLTDAVTRLADDDDVAALIVSVDSPGGSVAGGESLHDAIARVAARKPVVTVMRGTAASAGYMVSVPAARIFAGNATLTGSIGVLLQTAEVSTLLQKIGVDASTLVSGPLKDQPGLTHPLSPEGREVLQGLVMDLYDQFVALVATGRHMDPARVRELADGRAYTGRQALALGLVDQIGGESEAREWLAKEKRVGRFLPVRDVHPPETLGERFARGATGMLGGMASGFLHGAIESVASPNAVRLDGAWAVWQP